MTRLLTTVVALAALPAAALAQGLIVDQRPSIPVTGSYEVKSVQVDATVRDQVAEVQVSQTFYNPSNTQMEVEYLFPLPDDGAVQALTLTVDGREMPGRILKAEEARAIYESIVRAKKDPALLEYVGRGLFRTSVFPVAARASSTVTMKYTKVCRRDFNAVAFSYPIGTHRVTGKPVGLLSVRTRITGRDPIKAVYSPTHAIDVRRPGETEAVAAMEMRDAVPAGDFRLFYTLGDEAVSATVLSYRESMGDDGYFLVLASPGFARPDRKPAVKSVVFVIDKSGSMSGKKIEQAREAARYVVNHLNEGDTFNIIAYNGGVEMFKPEMQILNADTRTEALAYIEGIRDGGSTNIDSALRSALGMLQDRNRPNYILFLTDGLPTEGEQNEMAIAANCRRANELNARIVSFGVGFDVNARLLDRLTSENGGVGEYVTPDENLEAAVSRFASRLTAPVLTDVAVELAGARTMQTYPRTLPDLFEGGQIVYVGRYAAGGKTEVTVRGKLAGEPRSYRFPATLADASDGSAYAFVEKLWATRRIGDIIDQLDLKGRNQELVDELVRLSTKHGIMTPYTSFLADEDVSITRLRENAGRAAANTAALDAVSGAEAFHQREAKQAYKSADQAPAEPMPTTIGLDGETRVVTSVRNVGAKTFYQKAGVWRDAAVDEDDEKNAIEIRQFSDEYFALVRRNRAELNQYVTFNEDTLVELDGQAYMIRR